MLKKKSRSLKRLLLNVKKTDLLNKNEIYHFLRYCFKMKKYGQKQTFSLSL